MSRDVEAWAVFAAAGVLSGRVCAQCAVEPPKTQRTAVDSPAPDDDQTGEVSELPDYGGDVLARRYLSGSWGGTRDHLAASGLTFDLGWTQVVQGVVRGGSRRDWDYGGNLDLALNADLERLHLAPGGSLLVRGESRYGETVNDDAGTFTPVNTRGFFPLATSANEGIPFAITELSIAFPVGETMEVTVGKMITVDGDPTEFAGGRGRTQFLNSNFVYNAATSLTSPYSALGGLVEWTPAHWLTLSTGLFETTDSSTTTGFNHLNQGWTWWTQAATQYRLGTLPGGFNAGAQYAFGNHFTDIGGSFRPVRGAGVTASTVTDSWAVFAGAWQYLFTLATPPDEIDAADDQMDVGGLGVFARFGFADPDSNPVHWSLSVGIAGRGLLPGRESDTVGLGYYRTELQTTPAFAALGLPSSTQGVEAFYNVALTPAAGLTVDVQWVDEGPAANHPATVLGVRMHVEF